MSQTAPDGTWIRHGPRGVAPTLVDFRVPSSCPVQGSYTCPDPFAIFFPAASTSSAPTPAATPQFTTGDYTVSWLINALQTSIDFTLTLANPGTAGGWIAISFNKAGAMLMAESDVYLCGYDPAGLQAVSDYDVTSYVSPTLGSDALRMRTLHTAHRTPHPAHCTLAHARIRSR
jgi:hypothetical protein